MSKKYKVVFEDNGTTKVVKGHIEDLDKELLQVQTNTGSLYISKKHITFIKELTQGGFSY